MRKTILISGANSGLAKKVAIKLIKNYNLILVYHKNKPDYNLGKHSFFFKYDLTSNNNLSSLARKINKRFTVNAILHFNGLHTFSTFKNSSVTEFQSIFEVNCLTFINLIKFSYDFNKLESIVTISSVASIEAKKGTSLYSSSKSALNNLVKCAAIELSKRKIRVNSIILGHINQGMGIHVKKFLNETQLLTLEQKHLLGFGTIQDLIYSIKFLVDKKKSRWITGSLFFLDGGYSA